MEADEPDEPLAGPRFTSAARAAFSGSEEAVYIVVGVLLVVAAVLVGIGTINDLVNAIRRHEGTVSVGITLLDRILLLLIVAELIHTLRFVVVRGRIAVEPFLFVGLIAVVRRILIITAQVETQIPAGQALTNALLQLGLLGFLALALAVAIYLVRRSGPPGYDPASLS